MNIPKQQVYYAFGNEYIWFENTQENFIALYKSGYRFITHYDAAFDTLYKILPNGDYGYVHDVTLKDIVEDEHITYVVAKIKTTSEATYLAGQDDTKVIWVTQSGDKYEITKNDPIWTFLYECVPASTNLYNFQFVKTEAKNGILEK